MALGLDSQADLDWTDSSHLSNGYPDTKKPSSAKTRASQSNQLHAAANRTTYRLGVYHIVTTQDKDAQNIPFQATTSGLPEHVRAEIVNYRYNPNFRQNETMERLQAEADAPNTRTEDGWVNCPPASDIMAQIEADFAASIQRTYGPAPRVAIVTNASGTTVRQNYTGNTEPGWWPSSAEAAELEAERVKRNHEIRAQIEANEAAHAPARRGHLSAVGGTSTRGWTDNASGDTSGPPPFTPVAKLDWGTFLEEDFGKAEFLSGQLIQPGQQAALVGEGKAGKSLFALEWAQAVASGRPFLGDKPHKAARVLYIDQENSWVDIQARAHSLGYTPSDLDGIHYLSFPTMPPLDTAEGGDWLMTQVEQAEAEIVILDTVSRMVEGKENDSDTWLNLYRLSLKRCKSRKVATLRLDHFGKDVERGSRGSSAKNQDVDAVWELTAGGKAGAWGQPLRLKRTHTRSGLGPGDIYMNREGVKTPDGDGESWARGQTRHVIRELPSGLEGIGDFKVAEELARLAGVIGVSRTAGRETLKGKVMAAYPERRHGNDVWADAARLYKDGIDRD